MINNFDFSNRTKIIFGKDTVGRLTDELKKCGEKILFTYGGGSIKKTGLYDRVMEQLKATGKTVFELGEIEPNPRLATVHKGVDICKNEKIDFILAVGGGSVIDCSKAIAAGAKVDFDPWKFYLRQEVIKDAVPLGTIITLAATGTEMNGNSVISNWETKEKIGLAGVLPLLPVFSILDPQLTYSVPANQTANGSVDIMAHVFEQYFSFPDNTPLNDGFAETIIKTVIDNAPKALKKPDDYEARANLMWSSTLALNYLIGLGKDGEWSSHDMEHAISGVYDIAHGAGLAIIFPAWMKYVYKNNIPKFKRYAINVWNVDITGKSDEDIALGGISKTKEFFKSMGAPVSLKEAGIGDEHIKLMAKNAVWNGDLGNYMKLSAQDVENIYLSCLE